MDTRDESEPGEDDMDVDIDSGGLERGCISHLKMEAAYVLKSRKLHFVHHDSNKVMTVCPWQSESWNRKPKNEAEMAAHRWKRSTDERRRREEMKELFEKLKLTLGFPAQHQVAKHRLLYEASEEIQQLTDQEVRLTDQKKLLRSKQNALICKVAALTGRSRQVILKKIEYISAKRNATEAQKNRPCQGEPVETENDSFKMPRIENVTSLAAEGNALLNLAANKYVILDADSKPPGQSLQIASQEVPGEQPDDKAEAPRGKESPSPRTTRKNRFPQKVNICRLKGAGGSFATKHCIEELAGSQAGGKQTDRRGGGQTAKDASSQKLQPKDFVLEVELQNVASAVQEAALDASDVRVIEENDDAVGTLSYDIAFLNPQLKDNSSDIAELPNSLSSGFSLGDVENHRESSAADGSPFQIGALHGTLKDLCLVQDSNGSITPLLIHRNLRDRGVFKSMPDHEGRDSNPDCAAITSDKSPKHTLRLVNATNLSPSILQMRTNLEPSNTEAIRKPMPKLAPFGRKGTNFQLDSRGHNSKVMPLLSHSGTKLSSIKNQPRTKL